VFLGKEVFKMLLLPILVPVVAGLLIGAVLVIALGAILFSAVVSAAFTAGSSLIAYRQKKAASPEEAVPSPVVIPTEFEEVEDWPEAA
jgi:cell division septation protein DedD